MVAFGTAGPRTEIICGAVVCNFVFHENHTRFVIFLFSLLLKVNDLVDSSLRHGVPSGLAKRRGLEPWRPRTLNMPVTLPCGRELQK